MAENIPIRQIPGAEGDPTASSLLAMDNGIAMSKTTVKKVVDAGAPVASQAEAQGGVDNDKRMSALRVKQSIASEVGVSVASASQGSLADTAVQAVNGHTGSSVNLSKADVGLGNVDNTSDASKPVSTAAQAALDLKANAADLGALAVKSTVNNSDWSGADLAVDNGGTGASTPAAARANLGLGTAATTDSSEYATAAQGALAETAVQPGALGTLSGKDQIDVPADINATGVPSASTALFGDGSWKNLAGGGDMLSSTYDPHGIEGDAFAAANHTGRRTTDFLTVSDLLADESLAYGSTTHALTVAAGAIVNAEGFRYEVAASDATDAHVETEGGVKLNALPSASVVSLDAWGEPTGDDATAFAQALRLASDNRCKLVGWAGAEAVFQQPLDMVGIDYLDVDMGGATITVLGVGSAQRGFRIANAVNYKTETITTPLTVGMTSIPIADTTGISPGDILRISSTQVYNQQRPTEFFVNNLVRVKSVSSGSVEIDEPLYNNFDTASFTVTARFTKPILGSGITGLHVAGEGSANSRGLEIIGGIGFDILRCGVSGFKESGIELTLCFDSGITKCEAVGIDDSVLGYGLYLSSCKRGYIRRSKGRGNRHSFEVGGISEDCVVERCEAVLDTSYGAASHGNARRVTFRKNRLLHCAGGIVSRGEAALIEDNDLVGSAAAGLIVIGEVGNPNRIGLAGVRTKVRNNTLTAEAGQGAGIHCTVTMNASDITGNRFKGHFGSNIILINGESCDGGSLIADNDMTEATSSFNAVNITPQVADKIDVAIRGLRQRGCLNGVNIIEPAGSTGVSKVSITECDLRGNSNRPVIINGKYDTVVVGGGTVFKNNANPNGQRPAEVDVATYLEYGLSGTMATTSPI